jgi:hypothetical protein
MTREALRNELMSCTMKELLVMATPITSVTYPTKARMVNHLVELMIGRRLDSEAIERVGMQHRVI